MNLAAEITFLSESGIDLKQTIDTLNDLAWELRDTDPKKAQSLTEKAYSLATSSPFERDPYPAGLATAIRNIGYLNNLNGEFRQTLTQSRQALTLIEGIAMTSLRIEILRNVGMAYNSLGNFAEALEYEFRALKLARETGDREREAFVLDTVGQIYLCAGDTQRALDTTQDVLLIYRDLAQKRGESVALNNIATIYLQTGDRERALESGLKSLELARENGFTALRDCIYSTVGEIYMESGEYDQAAEYMHLYLEYARRDGGAYILVWALTLLGRLNHYRNNDLVGLPYLEEALEISRSSGFLIEQSGCLELLAEIFEAQGKYKKALLYFKQFHILSETINNQEKQRKIAQLESVFQIETFKKEAEKLYQHSMELQKEVNERRQAQAALEELATLDPLTNLLNRRHFYYLAEHAIDYAQKTHHQLSIIMIDIDHFKKVNDSYGHIVGDQVLSKIGEYLQRYTRSSDIVARFGGEEFIVLLPETSIHEAWQMAERLRLEVAAASFPTRFNQFSITVSLGLADLPEGTAAPMDELLDWADQALYGAKQSGRNNTVVFQHHS